MNVLVRAYIGQILLMRPRYLTERDIAFVQFEMVGTILILDTRVQAYHGWHEDKLYNILQAMAPTNVETVHQTSLFYIESNPNQLGLLSPTHGQRSQQQSGQITHQSVLINKPKFFKAIHHT